MSLYYEAAELLTTDSKTGSLKSRIYSSKHLKSPPGQLYALIVESCKWSSVLREVIENADFLRLERKVTPILSVFLVHDLLLAKRGIALPATHGLRSSIERHRTRLQAEFTKARIRRKMGSVEAFKRYIETQYMTADSTEASYPRWIRINTIKTTLEDQLDTTFDGYEHVTSVSEVCKRATKRIHIDSTIPNLIGVLPSIQLTKCEAYRNGSIIFQDKASCFPAYLLDPLPEDGDIIDSCSAPGNKTTHIAALLSSRTSDVDECVQTIHAFEKNKGRAETLEKMVSLAGSQRWTRLHPGQDFLRIDPHAAEYRSVGALLLDPSCSGTGIVGRDDVPQLHIPVLKQASDQRAKHQAKAGKMMETNAEFQKQESGDSKNLEVMVNDDGEITAVDCKDDLQARLVALSKFQLQLLLHAFKFPSARKVTYSTCSVHAQENENVVIAALADPQARQRGWQILKRDAQVRGMRDWPIRGSRDACGGNVDVAEACIRTNKGDEHGTMGFFVAAFVRVYEAKESLPPDFLRDEQGHIIRDVVGFPVSAQTEEPISDTDENLEDAAASAKAIDSADVTEEWAGFKDEDAGTVDSSISVESQTGGQTLEQDHSDRSKKRPNLGLYQEKKKKKKKTRK